MGRGGLTPATVTMSDRLGSRLLCASSKAPCSLLISAECSSCTFPFNKGGNMSRPQGALRRTSISPRIGPRKGGFSTAPAQLSFPGVRRKAPPGSVCSDFQFSPFQRRTHAPGPRPFPPVRSSAVRSCWSRRGQGPRAAPSSSLQETEACGGSRLTRPASEGRRLRWRRSLLWAPGPEDSGLHVDSVASMLARGSPFEALCCQERLFRFKPNCRLSN